MYRYFLAKDRDAREGETGVWKDGSCLRSSPSWETAFLGGDSSLRDDEGKGN